MAGGILLVLYPTSPVVSKVLMDKNYSAAVAGIAKTVYIKTIIVETDVTCDPP